MELKLSQRKYSDKKPLIEDFNRIFTNARKYNNSTTVYFKAANDLEKVVKPLLDKLTNPSEEELVQIKKETEKILSDSKKDDGQRTLTKRKNKK